MTVLKYQSDCVAIRNREHTESLDSKGAELSRWKVSIRCVRWWGSSSWSASSCYCIFSILFRFDTDFSAFSARPLQSKRLLDRCQLSDSLPWGSALVFRKANSIFIFAIFGCAGGLLCFAANLARTIQAGWSLIALETKFIESVKTHSLEQKKAPPN